MTATLEIQIVVHNVDALSFPLTIRREDLVPEILGRPLMSACHAPSWSVLFEL
jgi:hypothetical protein